MCFGFLRSLFWGVLCGLLSVLVLLFVVARVLWLLRGGVRLWGLPFLLVLVGGVFVCRVGRFLVLWWWWVFLLLRRLLFLLRLGLGLWVSLVLFVRSVGCSGFLFPLLFRLPFLCSLLLLCLLPAFGFRGFSGGGGCLCRFAGACPCICPVGSLGGRFGGGFGSFGFRWVLCRS